MPNCLTSEELSVTRTARVKKTLVLVRIPMQKSYGFAENKAVRFQNPSQLMIAALFLLLPCCTQKNERNPAGNVDSAPSLFPIFRNSQFLTLSQTTRLEGPVLTSTNQVEATSKLVQTVLLAADSVAQPYAQAGDARAYWSFLFASLVVALHEGNWVHFRRLTPLGDACNEEANSGSQLATEPAAQEAFRRLMQGSGDVPSCSDFHSSDAANQILVSGDKHDMGVFQLRIRWNIDNYIAPKKYLSVAATARYALEYYFKGFQKIYSTSSLYPCLLGADGKLDYTRLIRGAWAGKYNSGKDTKQFTCRFENIDEKDARPKTEQDKLSRRNKLVENPKDLKFLESVLRALDANNLQRYLDAPTQAAFNEVQKNFQRAAAKGTPSNSRLTLATGASSELGSSSNVPATTPERSPLPAQPVGVQAAPTVQNHKGDPMIVTATRLNLRDSPPSGTINATFPKGKQIYVLAPKTIGNILWYPVDDGSGWVCGTYLTSEGVR